MYKVAQPMNQSIITGLTKQLEVHTGHSIGGGMQGASQPSPSTAEGPQGSKLPSKLTQATRKEGGGANEKIAHSVSFFLSSPSP